MTIIRGRIEVEDHFTITPNAWARDARLSRRARGLLLELLSHREGWEITVESLVAAGLEGHHAIRTALKELEEHGYLQRGQDRADGGKFGGASYVLTDPTVVRFSDIGLSVIGESATKKTIPKKTIKEIYTSDVRESDAVDAGFDGFWDVYPKRVSKGQARVAWRRAVKSVDPELIVAGAERYRDDPKRSDDYTKNPATWLNGECWADEQPAPVEVPGGRLWEE